MLHLASHEAPQVARQGHGRGDPRHPQDGADDLIRPQPLHMGKPRAAGEHGRGWERPDRWRRGPRRFRLRPLLG